MEVMQQDEAPVETPAPSPEPSVDDLLAEFDRRTTTPVPEGTPEPSAQEVSPSQPGAESQNQSVDDWLKALDSNDQKVTELQGQVDAMRTAEHRRAELEAFDKYADELAQQMPSWAPPDYVRAKLQAMAHDPELCLAWDTRNVDPRQANLELVKVQLQLNQLQRTPGADPAQVQQLQQYGYQLQVALNSKTILRQATVKILNDAKKIPPLLDQEAMETKADIAQAMRGASAPVDFKEPPPNFGAMSDAELREYTKKNFGF